MITNDQIDKLSNSIELVSDQIKKLGLNGADTHLGAIEALSMKIEETSNAICKSLDSIDLTLSRLINILESKK